MLRSHAAVVSAAICLFASAAGAGNPPQYDLTVIGGFPQSPAFGPVSSARAINDHGVVVGSGSMGTGGTSGLLWQGGSVVNLGIPAGYDRSFANRINQAGQIVGGALTSGGSGSAALFWSGGSMVNLGTLGGQNAGALGINDHGRIVGYSTMPGEGSMRAFAWHNGTMSMLTAPAWSNDTIAYDISNSGFVAGMAGTTTYTRAIMWNNGVLIGLPVPAGSRAAAAVAVNEHGWAVGNYEISQTNNEYGAGIWQNGQRIDLGFLGPTQYTIAADINDSGQVVGTAARASGAGHTGFLWQEGVIYDLRSLLIPSVSEYQIVSARAINSSGQIAAVAMIGGRETAVLLAPVPTPGGAAMLLMAGVVVARRRRAAKQ